ncbi:MAG: zeta toxin family protein [Candidatus Saccharimonadales bacterium]
MNDDQKLIEQEATRWVRRASNKRKLVAKFAALDDFPSVEQPVIVFLAGSHGAGKTEFIKGFRQAIKESVKLTPAVLDPDAIRELLSGYTGNNSHLFQRPVAIAIDDLYRTTLKHKQHVILDGTFADYEHAHNNVTNALMISENVMICYVFQHPAIAWHFTQLREVVEGRNIRKGDFVTKFIGAKQTVDKIKATFGDKVTLHVILKDYKDTAYNKEVANVFPNAANIEQCIDFYYTKETIERILEDEAI